MNVNYVLKHLHHVITEFSVSLGVSCKELSPVKTEEFSSEGSSVTLSYNYSTKAAISDNFFWYRQYPGKPPEFLISHTGTGKEVSDPVSGLSFKVMINAPLSDTLSVKGDSMSSCCCLEP
uniref:Immunoglobulin V-set domain-containing protein n=1 Tax=Seriola dumerili TaxID=41447 RepID=A0A3B4VQX7_SERDU